jgi:hypothetical protein
MVMGSRDSMRSIEINVIKILCLLFTNVCNKLVFVPGKPFQASLIFVGKARSPLLKVLPSGWKKTSDLAEKDCQRQTL